MADRAYDYAYDPAGNRTQQVVTLDGVQDSSLTYTYNALNQLTGDGSDTYEYDDNGNLIKTNGQTTHTYDRANRLLSYGGSSYAYDGQGNRVSQTVDSVVTQYLLDVQPGLATVLAATTGQDTTRYLHGPLGLQSQHQPDDSWAFPLVDGLGSVRGVVNEDLSHLESRQYTPYGEEYGTTGTEQTVFGFTGEPVDANGLVHLRARYYDPGMGRFFQIDPSWQEANLYQYGFGNPVGLVDPSGLISEGQAEDADHWRYLLSNNFYVTIDRDYGWGTKLEDEQTCPDDQWNRGAWELEELEDIYYALDDVQNELGGLSQFRNVMGQTTIIRGNTPDGFPAYVDTNTKEVILDDETWAYGENFMELTIAHEYGHIWDSNQGFLLSEQMYIEVTRLVPRMRCVIFCTATWVRVWRELPPDIGNNHVLNAFANRGIWYGIPEDWGMSFSLYIYSDYPVDNELGPIRQDYIRKKIHGLN